jgi:hypothetical protein
MDKGRQRRGWTSSCGAAGRNDDYAGRPVYKGDFGEEWRDFSVREEVAFIQQPHYAGLDRASVLS